MHVANSDMVANIDVDDTLILWDDLCFNGLPANVKNRTKVVCPYDGTATWHKVHKRHVMFLKKLKARGYTIVVWSAAGTQWAEAVVKALELEDWVDWVQAKPQKVIDDLVDSREIIGEPFYLDEDGASL